MVRESQKRATKNWREKNRERVNYTHDKSTTKGFILKKATKEDLILIKKWIEEREKKVD